jgi:putative drug exporter of the RND superfamily
MSKKDEKGNGKDTVKGSRPSFSVRWGTWIAHHRWWVLGAWIVLFLASAAAYPHLLSNLSAPDYSVTGSDSAEVVKIIGSEFTAAGSEQDVIVFDSDTLLVTDPEFQTAVSDALNSIQGQPGVVAVTSPYDPLVAGKQFSSDMTAAFATLGLNGDDRERAARSADMEDLVEAAAASTGVEAYLTGYSQSSNDLTEVENADVERAESIGVPIALIVLILALAAVIAGIIPLIIALVNLTFVFGLLSLLVFIRPLDSFLLSIVTMIGVGISIDYSLFILTRFREEFARAKREGKAEPETIAVGIAMRTSGRTIIFSGTIVMISLFSLFIVKSPIFVGMAIGAVIVVLCTLFTAWTFLPALLAVLGERVNKLSLPKKMRPADSYESEALKTSGWARWARTVIKHPWLAIPAAALLILFALPTLGMALGIDLGLASISDTPTGKAEIILTEKFTPGLLSPVQILVTHMTVGELDSEDYAAIKELTDSLQADDRVAAAYSISTVGDQVEARLTPEQLSLLQQEKGQLTTRQLNMLKQQVEARLTPEQETMVDEAEVMLEQMVNLGSGANRTIITAVTEAPIDSKDATDLVSDIRDNLVPQYEASGDLQVLVGGSTAQFEDLGEETLSKLPWVMAIVLTLSFLYLLLIFRSLLIPVKAVVMNLLATFAAFGLTTWVFADGHLEKLFGFTSVGFIQTYLPVMVFALLFGLSMDYEVFLVGRMHEQWLLTHDNDDAIITGVAHTGRTITAAAAIMAAVFGCFLVADVLELKEFGFALAVAVVLDATIVRLLLVPAVMKMAGGEANWWIPKWLEKILPDIKVE